MIRFLLKEASLMVAFVMLGAILLFSIWFANSINQGILREFRNSQVSVVLKPGAEDDFRRLVDRDKSVLRYEIYDSAENKERLGKIYPELRNVVGPLDAKFFPNSALVVLKDSSLFLANLRSNPDLYEVQILHEPPRTLMQFLNFFMLLFSLLWVMTLGLVLYFNLERLTVQQAAEWSLIKMLGARSWRVFMPLLYGQSLRALIASLLAVFIAWLAVYQLKGQYTFTWSGLSLSLTVGFIAVSLVLTSLISYFLFRSRYQRINLG